MARADLLRKLFQSYQRRDDDDFRAVAAEVIDDERKKQHLVLANELERILKNGGSEPGRAQPLGPLDPLPFDNDRRSLLLEVKRPDRYLEDLILEPTACNSIRRVLQEFAAWDVLEANGLAPARKILFCGPSGCGKTVTAEAIAAELSLPLIYVRFDSVVSSLLGETAANLRKVFDYARRGQWVLLFDEFDAIGRSRDDPTEHGEIKRVVNSFLQILDSFEGRSLIIAATNFEQALDPAIWRRFDEIVRFEKPDTVGIRKLVRRAVRPVRLLDDHLEQLVSALAGDTYADAERAALAVRKSCALRGDRVSTEIDVQEAISRHEYRQRVLTSAHSHPFPTVDQE